MDKLYSDEVLEQILDCFNEDNSPENMDGEAWDNILQEHFNTTEEHFDYDDYMSDYPTILETIHSYAEDIGLDPEYWNFQKMINLYMYIVANEIIGEKDYIIEIWQDRHSTYQFVPI